MSRKLTPNPHPWMSPEWRAWERRKSAHIDRRRTRDSYLAAAAQHTSEAERLATVLDWAPDTVAELRRRAEMILRTRAEEAWDRIVEAETPRIEAETAREHARAEAEAEQHNRGEHARYIRANKWRRMRMHTEYRHAPSIESVRAEIARRILPVRPTVTAGDVDAYIARVRGEVLAEAEEYRAEIARLTALAEGLRRKAADVMDVPMSVWETGNVSDIQHHLGEYASAGRAARALATA